jgi:hypothetical protein
MQNESFVKLFIILISGVCLWVAPPARGDVNVYWDSDYGFYPSTVVIAAGETVTWWNNDPYGADVLVTLYNGSYAYLQQGDHAGLTFNLPTGSYGFYSDWGDHGAVIVNAAPTVAITSPVDNAVFPEPATFIVQATPSDTADDSISDVEFFLGTSDSTNSIEDVFSSPYSTGITNLAAGTYTLLAVARDSHGWTATNAITVTVTAGATVSLGSPRLAAGKFLFDVTGLTVAKTNIVQVTTNLVAWTSVKTNIAVSAAMTVTNAATAPRQFYRVLQLP